MILTIIIIVFAIIICVKDATVNSLCCLLAYSLSMRLLKDKLISPLDSSMQSWFLNKEKRTNRRLENIGLILRSTLYISVLICVNV